MKRTGMTHTMLLTLSAIFIAIVSTAWVPSPASACWMEMKARLEDDAAAAPGDTVNVLFSLTLTHGNCLVEISDTEFSATGAKIIGATKWKRIKERPVVVERKLRVVVIADGSDGEVSVSAERKCERMGGETTLVLIPAESGGPPGKEE